MLSHLPLKCRFLWIFSKSALSQEINVLVCAIWLISYIFFFFFFLKNSFIFIFIYLFIYFWLCWVFVSVPGLSLVAASRGPSSSRCAGLSPSRPLPLRGTGSRHAGSAVVAHGPSRSAACGISPDQGSNPCPLHWQADSQPLRHQGSPSYIFLSPSAENFFRSIQFSNSEVSLSGFKFWLYHLIIIEKLLNLSKSQILYL